VPLPVPVSPVGGRDLKIFIPLPWSWPIMGCTRSATVPLFHLIALASISE
jgi:hypothetical protein